MLFRVKAKVIFITVAIAIVFTLFLLLYFISRKSLVCPQLKSANNFSDKCGLVVSTSDSSHMVAGIVRAKPNDFNILTFSTADSKGGTLQEEISLPPSNIRTALTTRAKNKIPFESSGFVPTDELLKHFSQDTEVLAIILTVTPDELTELKRRLGDTHFIRCYKYNNSFIQYLQKPSFIGRMLLLKDKISSGCVLSVQQFIVYQ